MRGSGPTTRSRLILLVLVATVPMLVFTAVLLERAYRVSFGLVEDNAVGIATRVAASVEARIGRAEAVAVVLSQLPARDRADLDALEETASHALAVAGLDASLDVIDANGVVVAGTPRPLAHSRRPVAERANVERLFTIRRAFVTSPVSHDGTNPAEVSIHVPMLRDGKVLYDIAVHLTAASFASTTVPTSLPDRWFVIISGEGSRVVTDTSERSSPSEPLPPEVVALYRNPDLDFGEVEYVDNERILLGFARSARSGWMVGVAVPSWVIYGPLLRSVGLLAAGGAALLLVSSLLAWLIGRNINRPLAALAEQARALGEGRPVDLTAIHGLAEAEAVGAAMQTAAAELQARSTEREAALARAESSEARLLLAQEVGEIGTWEIDLATGERRWSQQLFQLFGRDPALGAPHGHETLAYIHPEDRTSFAATQALARNRPMNYTQTFRIKSKSGAVRWLSAAARSQFEDGRPISLVGITMDVTERREAERVLRDSATKLEAEVAARTEQLALSEERFRTYFEHSSDALVILRVEDGPCFVYEIINRAAERLFGVQAIDIIGYSPQEVLTPAEYAAMKAIYEPALATTGPTTVQRSVNSPAGILQVETTIVPVTDPLTGKIVRVISGSRDLTERQRIEQRLAHAQRLEAVGQLTGGVAHDFNNLLTVVIGNLSLLRRRLPEDERAQRYLASVEAAAERGAKLTAGLLAFSRRQALQVEQVDVGQRIRESSTLLRRAVGEDIEFALDVQPGLPLANADAAKLEAAVLNLVINARDAVQERMAAASSRTAPARPGRVALAVLDATLSAADLDNNDEAKPGRFVAIVVEDTGTGMTASIRARAFEPFFTTKEVGRGTGLGLSQVFGFVRQLGGHVVIDSTPEHGTRVTMFLPEAAIEVSEPAPTHPEPAAIPPGTTVLVVEDDASIRDVVAEMLADSGLSVRTAESGPAALDILRAGARVDLLFTDVVLPGGATGIDLARSVHELRPRLAVLLTSGYDGAALSRLGGEHEYEVLAKPYTRAALLERISKMLTPDGAPSPPPAPLSPPE